MTHDFPVVYDLRMSLWCCGVKLPSTNVLAGIHSDSGTYKTHEQIGITQEAAIVGNATEGGPESEVSICIFVNKKSSFLWL